MNLFAVVGRWVLSTLLEFSTTLRPRVPTYIYVIGSLTSITTRIEIPHTILNVTFRTEEGISTDDWKVCYRTNPVKCSRVNFYLWSSLTTVIWYSVRHLRLNTKLDRDDCNFLSPKTCTRTGEVCRLGFVLLMAFAIRKMYSSSVLNKLFYRCI